MHRQPKAERLAHARQMLHLPQAAPVVGVAEHDLHGVVADGDRQVVEARGRDVAGQGRVDALGEQRTPYRGHAVEASRRVLEIPAVGQLSCERTSDAHRRLDRPCAVRIDAQGHAGPERDVHGLDRGNLLVWIEHAGLELDGGEAVGLHHLPRLHDHRLRGQALAVLVVARVVALAASTRVLVEQVRRERHEVAHPPAEQRADGLSDGLADQVECRHLEHRVEAHRGIERVLAGHAMRLRAVTLQRWRKQRHQPRGQRPGAGAGDVRRHTGDVGRHRLAAVGLGQADDAVLALHLDDRAQRVRRVQPVRTAEWRVGQRDGVRAQAGDADVGHVEVHTRGNTAAASMVASRPATPITVSCPEKPRSVSGAVMPLMRDTTQKPLSFIHENSFDPNPMAAAR